MPPTEKAGKRMNGSIRLIGIGIAIGVSVLIVTQFAASVVSRAKAISEQNKQITTNTVRLNGLVESVDRRLERIEDQLAEALQARRDDG
jgi:hypothetical protein